MIKTHSDDPDIEHDARLALTIVAETLAKLPKADSYDYGGHQLKIGEYGVCESCTTSIAEAQAAAEALHQQVEKQEDNVVKEHLQLASKYFALESETAVVRAELHNGHGTEQILNELLGFRYNRNIREDINHSHMRGASQ
jgi:hypothetical protein